MVSRTFADRGYSSEIKQARRGEPGKGGVFEATEKGLEGGEKNGLVLHGCVLVGRGKGEAST